MHIKFPLANVATKYVLGTSETGRWNNLYLLLVQTNDFMETLAMNGWHSWTQNCEMSDAISEISLSFFYLLLSVIKGN